MDMNLSQKRRTFQIEIRKKKLFKFYSQSRQRILNKNMNSKINENYLKNLQIILSKFIMNNRKYSHRDTTTISIYV